MEDKSIWIWIFIAVALLFLLGSFGMGGYTMMGFGMAYGFIFMLLFWGVLIWLIVSLINAAGRREEDSLAILKRRYAEGKITKKQYEQMRRDLR